MRTGAALAFYLTFVLLWQHSSFEALWWMEKPMLKSFIQNCTLSSVKNRQHFTRCGSSTTTLPGCAPVKLCNKCSSVTPCLILDHAISTCSQGWKVTTSLHMMNFILPWQQFGTYHMEVSNWHLRPGPSIWRNVYLYNESALRETKWQWIAVMPKNSDGRYNTWIKWIARVLPLHIKFIYIWTFIHTVQQFNTLHNMTLMWLPLFGNSTS